MILPRCEPNLKHRDTEEDERGSHQVFLPRSFYQMPRPTDVQIEFRRPWGGGGNVCVTMPRMKTEFTERSSFTFDSRFFLKANEILVLSEGERNPAMSGEENSQPLVVIIAAVTV